MIVARLTGSGDALVSSLTKRAAGLARASLAARLIARRADPETRWRNARVLWPRFTKD
jgi:hypothetical protein